MRMDRESFGHIVIISIGCILLLLLTACADTFSVLEKPQPPKELVVHPAQFSHQVRFASASTRFIETEQRRLDGFLARLQPVAGDEIYLSVPVTNPADIRRRAVVAAFLEMRGLTPSSPGSDFGIPEVDKQAVRVVIRRHVVRLPGCPDWSKNPGRNFGNTVHSNFGCASSVNLGLMIADPRDIVHGRDPGPMDGEYAAGSIDRYRKGETKPLGGDEESQTAQPQQTTNISVGGGS